MFVKNTIMDAITSIKVQLETSKSVEELKKLQKSLKEAEGSLKEFVKTKKTDIETEKKLKNSVIEAQKQLRNTRKEFDYSKLSLNELTAVRRSLQSEMKKTLPDSDNFKNLEKDLRRVNSTYEQLNNRVDLLSKKSSMLSFLVPIY